MDAAENEGINVAEWQRDVTARLAELQDIVSGNGDCLGPGIFHGLENENALRWWQRYTNFADFRCWSDEKRLKGFGLYLSDEAERWFRNLPGDRRADMEILGETFLERFDKCGPTWLYDKMLFKFKQQSNQTVDQYASLLQLKAEKARKTDKEILSYFMNGLKPPLQAFVAGMNPSDFTSAYEHAKTAEVINKLQQEPEEESAELTEEIKERIGQLKELVKEMSDIESNLHEQSRQNDSQQTGKRRRKVEKYGRRKADSKAIRSNRRQGW
ncbi:uncharacterized protein [Ptychodera flava]|uniref:uncharacterized protein isoform X2 n=1 Tax=Ptychodera flava TaxID=63121 RepID=UPI00396A4539